MLLDFLDIQTRSVAAHNSAHGYNIYRRCTQGFSEDAIRQRERTSSVDTDTALGLDGEERSDGTA